MVQTYTYAIRPMREHSQNIGTLETMTDIMPTANGNGIATTATGLTNKSSTSSGGSAVHSYEVRCQQPAVVALGARYVVLDAVLGQAQQSIWMRLVTYAALQQTAAAVAVDCTFASSGVRGQ